MENEQKSGVTLAETLLMVIVGLQAIAVGLGIWIVIMLANINDLVELAKAAIPSGF